MAREITKVDTLEQIHLSCVFLKRDISLPLLHQCEHLSSKKDRLLQVPWFTHETICTTFEPPRWKTNNVVYEQVRHKLTCTSTEKSISDLDRRGIVLSK